MRLQPDPQWKDLLFWSFEGPRYEDNGIELSDLRALIECRALILATAKSLWKRANPKRERVLRNFEKRVQMKFFEVRAGSAQIPIRYRVVHEFGGPELPGIEDPREISEKVEQSAELLVKTLRAIKEGEHLPVELPRDVLRRFKGIADVLDKDVSVSVSTPSTEPVKTDRTLMLRLATEADQEWEDVVETYGEVRMAELQKDGGVGKIQTDKGKVEIHFCREQEKLVTGALHEHERIRLKVRGRGVFSGAEGSLKKVMVVDQLDLIDLDSDKVFSSSNSIWELAEEVRKDVPEDAWEELPRDGARNLDHYLYRKLR
jgi:hypothetical protein